MKCPDCGGEEFKISPLGGGAFHCQCKKCGNEFRAGKGVYGEPPIIKYPWPFKKWGARETK